MLRLMSPLVEVEGWVSLWREPPKQWIVWVVVKGIITIAGRSASTELKWDWCEEVSQAGYGRLRSVV